MTSYYLTLIELEEGEQYDELSADDRDYRDSDIQDCLWSVDMEEEMKEQLRGVTYDETSDLSVISVLKVEKKGRRPLFRVETNGSLREVEGKVTVKPYTYR